MNNVAPETPALTAEQSWSGTAFQRAEPSKKMGEISISHVFFSGRYTSWQGTRRTYNGGLRAAAKEAR